MQHSALASRTSSPTCRRSSPRTPPQARQAALRSVVARGEAMQRIAAIAIGLLVVGSIVVGVRLLILHRRTGAAPELLLGGMLLLAVGVGYPLMIATPRVSPASADMLQVISSLAIS